MMRRRGVRRNNILSRSAPLAVGCRAADRCRRRNRRSGYTLIEMLVVIAAISALIGAAGTFLHVMIRNHDKVREHAFVDQEIHRLSRLFRNDVHAAQSLVVADGESLPAQQLTLHAADGRQIQYEVVPRSVVRRIVDGGGSPRHDAFRLPKNVSCSFTVATEGDSQFVGIRWTPSPPNSAASPVGAVAIDALLNMDSRFDSPAPETNP